MNLYIIFGIVTMITGMLFSTFVSSWGRANREIGFWFGDGEKLYENNVQNVITSKGLQRLQGLTGLTPLVARLVPLVLFILGGVNIIFCLIGYYLYWFVIGVYFRVYVISKTSLLKVLFVDYNDLVNRYADYKKNNDSMRLEAMQPFVEAFENIIEFFQFLKENNFDVSVAEIRLWQDFINYVCLEQPFFTLKEAYINCYDISYNISNEVDFSLIGTMGTIQTAREKLKFNQDYYDILLRNSNFISEYLSKNYNPEVVYRIICLDMEIKKIIDNDIKDGSFERNMEYVNYLKEHLEDFEFNDFEMTKKNNKKHIKNTNMKTKNISKDDDFFKEEFEFSYAKVKKVLKKIGFDSYATFKKHVYDSKKIERKKFDNKEEEIDYLVQAEGYENFEDFYNTNMEID